MLFKYHRSIYNSNDFYQAMKRLVIRKDSVVKFQNIVVNFSNKVILFICYLFRLYKNMLKKVRDKTKMIFKKTRKAK